MICYVIMKGSPMDLVLLHLLMPAHTSQHISLLCHFFDFHGTQLGI